MNTGKKFIFTLLMTAVTGVCAAQSAGDAQSKAEAEHRATVEKVLGTAAEWDYIVEHGDSPEIFDLIEKQLNRFEGDDQERILLQCVAPALRQNAEYRHLGNLVSAANLKQGAKAPDIEGVTPDGKTVRLSDLKGKYVLLDFWASWCGPCREEVPYLKQALKSSKGHDNFAVLSVSLDKDAAEWKKALKTLKMSHAHWIHMTDMQDGSSLAATLYGVKSIPHIVLLNPKGLVIEMGLRGERMAAKIGRIMEGIESYE